MLNKSIISGALLAGVSSLAQAGASFERQVIFVPSEQVRILTEGTSTRYMSVLEKGEALEVSYDLGITWVPWAGGALALSLLTASGILLRKRIINSKAIDEKSDKEDDKEVVGKEPRINIKVPNPPRVLRRVEPSAGVTPHFQRSKGKDAFSDILQESLALINDDPVSEKAEERIISGLKVISHGNKISEKNQLRLLLLRIYHARNDTKKYSQEFMKMRGLTAPMDRNKDDELYKAARLGILNDPENNEYKAIISWYTERFKREKT